MHCSTAIHRARARESGEERGDAEPAPCHLPLPGLAVRRREPPRPSPSRRVVDDEGARPGPTSAVRGVCGGGEVAGGGQGKSPARGEVAGEVGRRRLCDFGGGRGLRGEGGGPRREGGGGRPARRRRGGRRRSAGAGSGERCLDSASAGCPRLVRG